ncbi:MAG: MerR family transcriptional regulator [Desulfovibrionaceae bacterium]|nr:MerR family transcriptional regulator [Desulfovibrionaceae bacterium]
MLTETEFLVETGISPEKFQDIIALGWVETYTEADNLKLYSDTDIYRVRKLVRICSDFELPIIGGTIIVDLLDRIASLENEVSALKAQIEGGGAS